MPYNGFNRTLGTVMVSFYIPDVSFVTFSLSVEFSRQAESFLAEFSIFLSVNFQHSEPFVVYHSTTNSFNITTGYVPDPSKTANLPQ